MVLNMIEGEKEHAVRGKGIIKMFIREKKVDCGRYREVDIIPRTDNADRAVRGKRGKKKFASKPKQQDLNEKNAKRYLVQLGNGNFGAGDLHVTLTYDNEHLPETVEEAEKQIANYLRRVNYRRKKVGLHSMKYILVTEYKFSKDGSMITRIHHHVIMDGGLSRDDVELLWTDQRINWKKIEQEKQDGKEKYRSSIKQLGFANADRIQPNENGIEALCKYIVKDPAGKKRWSSSRNLKRPVEHPPADSKYSRRQVERLAKEPDHGLEFFKNKFKKYDIADIKAEYYEDTGWHLYLKMWKKRRQDK